MEARQVIRPRDAGAPRLQTYDDPNRLIVPMPHWSYAAPKKVLATGDYAGIKVEVNVPTNLVRRKLYAGIVNSTTDSTDFGACMGEVKFYLGGTAQLALPFEYNPTTLFNREIGLHLNPNVATTPADCLAVDVASTNITSFLVPWRLRVACQKIAIEIDKGTCGAVNCWIILACLSEGEDV